MLAVRYGMYRVSQSPRAARHLARKLRHIILCVSTACAVPGRQQLSNGKQLPTHTRLLLPVFAFVSSNAMISRTGGLRPSRQQTHRAACTGGCDVQGSGTDPCLLVVLVVFQDVAGSGNCNLRAPVCVAVCVSHGTSTKPFLKKLFPGEFFC